MQKAARGGTNQATRPGLPQTRFQCVLEAWILGGDKFSTVGQRNLMVDMTDTATASPESLRSVLLSFDASATLEYLACERGRRPSVAACRFGMKLPDGTGGTAPSKIGDSQQTAGRS
jgi:hypothetical protein